MTFIHTNYCSGASQNSKNTEREKKKIEIQSNGMTDSQKNGKRQGREERDLTKCSHKIVRIASSGSMNKAIGAPLN